MFVGGKKLLGVLLSDGGFILFGTYPWNIL
jgi:hypothetical protein